MKREEVQILLDKIKCVLNKKCYFILSNREKNNFFCYEYSLSSNIIKKILKNLTIFEFAKIVDNCHSGYVDEKLYLFAPLLELVNSNGELEKIQVYIKINYIESCNTIVVVSLHKCDYKLKYAFK